MCRSREPSRRPARMRTPATSTPRCTAPSRPAELQSQVDDLDEAVTVETPLAPVGLEIGEGFGGDGVLHRFPGRLEFPYLVRGPGQHVALLRELGLSTERAVARDDLGVRVHEAQQAVRRRDHAVDAAAGGAVDVGIKAG